VLDERLRVSLDTLPLPIRVDEREVVLHDRFHLLQHKPIGTVTAHEDPIHETAFARIRELGFPLTAELRAIGRLDLDASGVLLWTTDGALVHAFTHPGRAVVREYEVALTRPFTVPNAPVHLDDGYVPRIVALEPADRSELHPALVIPDHTTSFARIRLESGRYHEVKRIFAALGSEVVGLCRVAHAGFRLPLDLAPGHAMRVDLDATEHTGPALDRTGPRGQTT
jgi:16S rRNA pseudouridine516 synthase